MAHGRVTHLPVEVVRKGDNASIHRVTHIVVEVVRSTADLAAPTGRPRRMVVVSS